MANKNKLKGKAFAVNSIDPIKLNVSASAGDFLAFNASGVLAPHVGMNVGSLVGDTVQFNQNVVISGDLTIQGSAVTVNSTDTSIADGMIEINSNTTGSASADGGVEVARAGGTTSKLYFSETTENQFAMKKGEDATEYIIASLEDANAADQALNSSLTGETARAMGIESGLAQDVIDEEAARLANDTVLSGMLSTQLSDFTGSIATHNTNISNAITASTAAEIVLSGSVDTEISREEARISTLTGLLSTEDGRQDTAMSGLTVDLATEISREQGEMSGLEGDLDNEITREGIDISALTTDLGTETTNATAKELLIQAEIDSFNADIAAETVRSSGATIALTAKFDAAFDKFGVGGTFDPSFLVSEMDDLIANGGTVIATRATALKAALTAEGMFTTTSEDNSFDSMGEYSYLRTAVRDYKLRDISNENEGQTTHTCKAEFTYTGATVTGGTLTIASPADVNVADYSGYGDIVVSCNGLQLPDAAVTFTITPGVKSSEANNQHLWVTAPVITDVKILVDQIHYDIEAGDFFIIKYDRLELHTDGAAKWNDHDETPYCCDATATNYNVNAANCSGTCTYPLSCSDTQITVGLMDAWSDGGGALRLYEADGVTEKHWINGGGYYIENAGVAEYNDIWCALEGTTYVIGLVTTDGYGSYGDSSVIFKNIGGETLPQNGVDLSVNGPGASSFPLSFNTETKFNITLDAGGTSVTVSLFV